MLSRISLVAVATMVLASNPLSARVCAGGTVGQTEASPILASGYSDGSLPYWGRAHAAFLARDMLSKQKFSSKRQVLTIAQFPEVEYFGHTTKSSEALQELLTSDFCNWHKGDNPDDKLFMIVERSQLEEVLKAQKLEMGDLFDGTAVKKVGKLIGADLILVGKVTVDRAEIVVNWRFIDVATGAISWGGSTGFPRSRSSNERQMP